jgi:hypothetical protein
MRFTEEALAIADARAKRDRISRSSAVMVIIMESVHHEPLNPPKPPKFVKDRTPKAEPDSPAKVLAEAGIELPSLNTGLAAPTPRKKRAPKEQPSDGAGKLVSLPEKRDFNPQPKRKWGAK